jgi:putative membrane protein
MMFSTRFAVAALAGLLAGAPALADEDISTAEVLDKLHASNVKEMRMGLMAIQRSRSQAIQNFGKTLVDDHSDADAKVVRFARGEKIVLASDTPPVEPNKMPMGAGFDAAFAKAMVRDHEKDIAEVTAAMAATQDKKLKNLLGDLLPVLEKHQDMAQKLVDQNAKS